MTKLLLTAFALGLASLDLTGALAAVGALGAGVRVRALMAFGYFSILGTVAFGTALSLIVGPRIAGFDWGHASSPRPHRGSGGSLRKCCRGTRTVGVGYRANSKARRTSAEAERPTRPRPDLPRWGGVLFALAAIFDPTFVSLVVIAGRAELFWPVVAAHSTWTLVSHTPLVFVLAPVVSGHHVRVVGWFQSWWARVSPLVVHVVTSVVLLVGTFLLLDAAWWYLTGEFLIPG